jgi:hypothetical protein
MKRFKIIQTVEEVFYIDAETQEAAIEILYNGELEPSEYGSMRVDSVEEYYEEM